MAIHPRVAVVGLGKVGFPLAVALAMRGVRVAGIDVAHTHVAALRRGQLPFENGLADAFHEARARITLGNDFAAAARARLSFVVVPTPSTDEGRFDLTMVRKAFHSLGRAVGDTDGEHTVVLVSTVLLGDCRRLAAVLADASGRRLGEDLGLCYSPAFVALGDVLHGFLQPDFSLIGESDARAGSVLEAVYRQLCGEQAVVHRMSLENAELTKVAVNSYVTMKISFSNVLSQLCERIPGGDVDSVSAALGSDGRIGPSYLRGATRFGGPCFPRDNQALAAVMDELGVQPVYPRATMELNAMEDRHLLQLVVDRASHRSRISILGMAYKPHCEITEESAGIHLARSLVELGHRVVVSDPAAIDAARAALGSSVCYCDDPDKAVAAADVIVLTTPWPVYRELAWSSLPRLPGGRGRTVVDCWRLLADVHFGDRTDYIAVGRNHAKPLTR